MVDNLPIDTIYTPPGTIQRYYLLKMDDIYSGNGGTTLNFQPILGITLKPDNSGYCDFKYHEQTVATTMNQHPDNFLTISVKDPDRFSYTSGYNSCFQMVTSWISSVIDRVGAFASPGGLEAIVLQILSTLDGLVIYDKIYLNGPLAYLALDKSYEEFQGLVKKYIKYAVLTNAGDINGGIHNFFHIYYKNRNNIDDRTIFINPHSPNISSFEEQLKELGIEYKIIDYNLFAIYSEDDLNLVRLTVQDSKIIHYNIGDKIKVLRKLNLL